MIRLLFVAGLALAILALAVETIRLLGPAPPEDIPSAAGVALSPSSAAGAPSAFDPPPLSSLDALFARPLFRPERRPPAPPPPLAPEPEPEAQPETEPAEVEAQGEEDQLALSPPVTLRGVVLVGSGGFALVEPEEGGRTYRLSVGETVENWRLLFLEASAATFERAGRRSVLRLQSADAVSDDVE